MGTSNDFIGGDGGPMVVLQASATSKWQGASDWDNSLMEGGYVETDYDVICETNELGRLVQRYNRDMLVLDDSSWGARIYTLTSGATAIVQRYGEGAETTESVVERVTKSRPSKSFQMNVQDSSLRLLVGADDGKGTLYGYKDVPIEPGIKQCDTFSSEDELVIIIKPL